jgi:hypothetical protein
VVLAPYERHPPENMGLQRDLDALQDNIEDFTDKLVAQPHLDGILLEDVSITTGQNTIEHKLDRIVRGYWMVLDDALLCSFRVRTAADDTGAAVNNTESKVDFDTADYNHGSKFDITTNNRFDAPHTGLYSFTGSVWLSDIVDGTRYEDRLAVNGTTVEFGQDTIAGAAKSPIAHITETTQSLTKDDYVELFVYHDSGSNEDIKARTDLTWFTGRALVGHSAQQSELSDDEKAVFLRLYSECDRTASLVVF